MVGETGFEPAAPWSQTKCDTKLRHSPIYSGGRSWIWTTELERTDLQSAAFDHFANLPNGNGFQRG